MLGGCLETICWHLKGSSAWLDPGGAILLLETSEEAPSPATVDAYLTDLEQLACSRRRRPSSACGRSATRPATQSGCWEVVATRTEPAGIPVLANFEARHTDPMVTLPFAVEAEVDAGARSLRLLEAATVDA